MPSFWCGMTHIPTPTPMGVTPDFFREQVGACPDIWFNPYLRFATRDIKDPGNTKVGFEIQYDLCTDEEIAALTTHKAISSPQDSRVEVDRGKVQVVHRATPGGAPGQHEVDITTSKSIRFATPLPTGGVALLACILGWADVTRHMMDGCLKQP